MTKITSLMLLSLVAIAAFAQEQTPQPERKVHGQKLLSNKLPAVEITFAKDFRYVGGQVVNLYGNALAEQHVFVKGAQSGPVERFYWVQFEHFLPTNSYTYDYKPERTTEIGPLEFIDNVTSFTGYDALLTENPQSDGAAIARLLAAHNLALPKQAVHVRMFYLPTPDKRTELMIIYGEAVAPGSDVPLGKELDLDTAAPEIAKRILADAKRAIKIKMQH